MKRLIAFFRSVNREAALDSWRNILAVIGFGTLAADVRGLPILYFVLSLAVLLGVWYADYMRHAL